MTVALEILTPFADFSELSEHFAQRVDDQRLMLPYGEAVGEGEWVTFVVSFADGSTALSGTGKCTGSYDNGEEHPPEYRFDVVVEELSLEGTAEVMFERLIMARNSMAGAPGADPATGEVSIAELEQQHAQQQAAQPLDSVEEVVDDDHGFDEPQPTSVANLDELAARSAQRSQPPPSPKAPSAPRGAPAAARPKPGVASAPRGLPSPHGFDDAILTRPTLTAAWSPEPEPRPDPATSSGLFDYGRGGLPKPAVPPRPDLPAERRVNPAPAPGRPARREAPEQEA
jgi:hypothetical protein